MVTSTNNSTRRNIYLLLVFTVPVLGIGIRANSQQLPAFVAAYAPDVLWAFLVFTLVRALAPRWPAAKSGLAALTFAFFMECSQLYQASWINNVRATRIGGLLLGFSFLWSDLVCYAVGVGLGVAFDRMLRLLLQRRSKSHDSNCARHRLG